MQSENATSSETNPPAEIWPPPNPRSAARPGFAQPAAPTAMRDDEYTEPKPAAAPTKKPPAPQSRNEFDDEDDDEDPVIEELSAPRAPVSRRGGGLAGSPAQLKQTTESWAMEDMEDELSNFSLAPKMVPRGAICSESHFSVLFGLAEPRRAGASFAGDLLYYDGLHRQDRLLRLTLSSSPTGGHTQRIGRTAEERARFADHGREAVPPLEFVLETKWQGVDVDWNGAEKIL